MKVKSRKELKDVKNLVESQLEITLKERENIGLSVPEEFDTFLKFYSMENALGVADPNGERPSVTLNLAPFTVNKLDENDRQKASALMHSYFDKFREIFNTEDKLFSLMYYPHNTVNKFMESMDRNTFEKNEEFFKARGKGLNEYLDEAKEVSKFAREYFRQILPNSKKALESEETLNQVLDTLRHELDHVDFYQNSSLYKNHFEKRREAGEIYDKFMKGENVSKQYANKNLEILEDISEVCVTLESKAHFFNQIGLNDWGNANYEKVKNKVMTDISLNYVEGHWNSHILESLISKKWSEGKMNRETSNYLFALVNFQSGSQQSGKYVIDNDHVNFDIANKVLYDEMPQWKKMFAENTKTAVNAIGDAYENDPSRLKRANEATNFNDFMEYTRGKK